MTRAVLSIGSNMGDRLARLNAVVSALGDAVVAVSPVYETDAWGVQDQDDFLNAVVIAEDPSLDAHGWLHRGQALENANSRVRTQKWGPRTLDVDVVCCFDGAREIRCQDDELTLPHPFAHERAFVLVPWLAADPSAVLTVAGTPRTVADLVSGLPASERDGVRTTDLALAGGH